MYSSYLCGSEYQTTKEKVKKINEQEMKTQYCTVFLKQPTSSSGNIRTFRLLGYYCPARWVYGTNK